MEFLFAGIGFLVVLVIGLYFYAKSNHETLSALVKALISKIEGHTAAATAAAASAASAAATAATVAVVKASAAVSPAPALAAVPAASAVPSSLTDGSGGRTPPQPGEPFYGWTDADYQKAIAEARAVYNAWRAAGNAGPGKVGDPYYVLAGLLAHYQMAKTYGWLAG